MRLSSISLGNFRGYLDEKRVPFSPNLTVILGPNGFGKSTILDAFEWLLSGQIARYERRDEARREEFIRHVDATVEPYVEALVEDGGRACVLRRERKSREKSVLRVKQKDGDWLSDADILSFLFSMDGSIQPSPARGLVFSDPFVAYHLLGQQTIQDFVQSEPRDRYEKLAPIIGVERYVTATEAMLKASREIATLLQESSRQLTGRKADLEELQNEIDALDVAIFEKPENVSGSAELLAREYEQLRARVPQDLGGNLPTELPPSVTGILERLSGVLPDLQLLLDTRMASLQRRMELASSLKSTSEVLTEKRSDIEQLKRAVETNHRQFETVRERIEFGKSRMQDLGARNARLNKESEQLRKQQGSIKTLIDLRAKHLRLADELDARQRAHSQIEQDLATSQKALLECLSEVAKFTRLLERSREGLTALVSRISPMERLLVQSQAVLDSQKGARMAQERANSLRNETVGLSVEVRRLREESQQLQAAAAAARNEFDSTSKNARSLQQLLAQLRLYIDSPNCPACGTEFHTREELVRRVDEKMTGESPQLIAISNRVQTISQRQATVGRQLEASALRLRQVEDEIKELTTVVSDWTTNLEGLRIAATELKLQLGVDIAKDSALINQALLNTRQQEERLRSSVSEQETSLASEAERRASLESQVQELRARSGHLTSDIEATKTAMANLDRTSAQIAKSLEQMNLSPLALEGKRFEVDSSYSRVQKELDDLQTFISAAGEELKALEGEIEPLQLQRERLNKLTEEVLRLEANFAQGASTIGFAIEFGDEIRFEDIQKTVTAEQSELSELQSLLAALIQTVNLAKRRIRSESHKARIGSLNEQIAALQRQSERLTQEQNIAKLAAERVRRAGEKRTERILGSCTSLAENYYNRMYPHPLWSKLEIAVDSDTSRGGRAQLLMSARRNHIVSQQVPSLALPRLNVKYSFSTGQLNLFALSLVLALAQLRSGEVFNTILLDDPVQAMDDMRIAELCWILLQLSRTRQVVVATGNQNFVDLLFHRAAPFKQELSIVAHLFQSMTSRGPEILLDWRRNDREGRGQRVA